MILRCTLKLLKFLGARPPQPGDLEPHDRWQEWYANLVWIDRRKCLLVTHARTLLPVFIPDVLKADLDELGGLLAEHIVFALADEGLPVDTFGSFGTVQLARTVDRRILGCMNDQAHQCQLLIDHAGGLNRCDFQDLNRRLRRTIHSTTAYARPIELVREHVQDAKPRDEHADRED